MARFISNTENTDICIKNCTISHCSILCDSLFIHLDALCFMSVQFERGEALDNIGRDVKKTLEAEGDEEGLKVLSKTVDNVRKKVYASISIFSTKSCFYIKTLICSHYLSSWREGKNQGMGYSWSLD